MTKPLLLATLLLAGCAQTVGVDENPATCAPGGCRDLTIHDVADDGRAPGDAPAFETEPALRIPGAQIRQVVLDVDDDGRPLLDVTLGEDSGRALQLLSEARVGRRVAIVLEGELLIAPYVNGPFGPQLRISRFEHLAAARQARQRLLGLDD